jgi:hypothetical protein
MIITWIHKIPAFLAATRIQSQRKTKQIVKEQAASGSTGSGFNIFRHLVDRFSSAPASIRQMYSVIVNPARQASRYQTIKRLDHCHSGGMIAVFSNLTHIKCLAAVATGQIAAGSLKSIIFDQDMPVGNVAATLACSAQDELLEPG